MPVVTGHETSGLVVQLGSNVTGFALGDKVTADNSELCGHCHYCRDGKLLFCENFAAHGVHLDGGFAEYCVFPAEKLFKFDRLSWEEAMLFEAASCAVHGLDMILPQVGSSVLLIGSGATGLFLAQLLRGNGGQHLVLASHEGRKMELARKLGVADEYVELPRGDQEEQWRGLKERYPYGFDVVVEATGSHVVLERAIECQHKSGVSDINETKRGDTCSIYVSPTCLAVDLRSIYAQR
jgi:D-arabinitol dehydrogenase (NADP+)